MSSRGRKSFLSAGIKIPQRGERTNHEQERINLHRDRETVSSPE